MRTMTRVLIAPLQNTWRAILGLLQSRKFIAMALVSAVVIWCCRSLTGNAAPYVAALGCCYLLGAAFEEGLDKLGGGKA